MIGKVVLSDGSRNSSNRQPAGCAPSGGSLREIHHTACPVEHCGRELIQDTSRSDGGQDPVRGLHHVSCLGCGHRGMIPNGDLQILFCTAHQYVVAYGPSLATITVVLTTGALAAYRAYAYCAEEIARLGTRWALLSGTRSGTVRLAPERHDSLGFGRYLQTHTLPRFTLRAGELRCRPAPIRNPASRLCLAHASECERLACPSIDWLKLSNFDQLEM